MTVAATPPRLARPNEKPAPNSERGMVGNDVLLSLFYLAWDAANDLIASAASSVIGLPTSRLWMVIRDTPRSLATCVGVPMDSRSLRYSAAVISDSEFVGSGDDGSNFKGNAKGTFSGGDGGADIRNRDVAMKVAGRFATVEHAVAVLPGLERSVCVEVGSALCDLNGDAGGDVGFVVSGKCSGCHGSGWFGVGRFQWRRGERKIDLRATQELSVKYFYAPFLRLNDPAMARRAGDRNQIDG